MMKTKIVAIGNQGNFNYIIVNKNKDFFDWLTKIIFNTFGYASEFIAWDEVETKKFEYDVKKKDIRQFIDCHDNFTENNIRFDLFFGKDTVFITFISSLETRKKIVSSLEKYSIWKKPKTKKIMQKVLQNL